MSSDLPSAGAKLTLDLSEWESNWSSAIGDAAELQSTIDDLSGSVDIDVNMDVPDTSELDEITGLDGTTTETELDITESEGAQQAIADIHFMALKDKIETVWNIAGTALDLVTGIGGKLINPFLDIDDTVARINAQTGSGTGIDDLGQFIRDVQAADLGTSVDQIGDMVVHATQLHAPIEEATTATLQFTKVFDDQDPVTVMTTLKTMADGFKISISEAGDLMTVAFQQGMNKGGDLMNVVNSSTQSWADMGLTAPEALSTINSLLQNNVDSAGDAQKMIQTLDDALTTAADNADSPQAEALKTLGMENPKDSGQAMGADFIDGFAASFANLPSDKQDLISGVLFGKGGKKFTGALEGMTTQGPFDDIKQAAEDAATEIDNSLRGAIDDFMLELNTKVSELLSSDKLDLPGKIKAIKEAIQRGVAEIQSGGTLGEGLEVALGIPGLSDTLNTFIGNFERIIGNLEIAFLQVVAAVQDLTGHGQEAQATRKTIFDRSMGQLQFDLQLANADEVDTMIQQAMSRGLNATNVGEALNTALNESIAKGDFNQGAVIIEGLKQIDPNAFNDLAADYVTKLSGGFDNAMSAGNLDLMQKLMAIDPNAKIPGLDEAVKGFQKQLSDAFAPQNRAGDTGGNPFLSGIGAGIDKAGATSQGGGFGGMNAVVQDFKTTMEEAQATAATATGDIATNFDHTGTAVSGSLATVNTALDTTGMTVEGLDMRVVNALTGNTVTTAFEAVATAADSAFPGVMSWFEKTGAAAAAFDNMVSVHLRSVTKQLADLNFLAQQVIANVTSAQQLGGSGTGGGGGTTNNTTNNVTVNNTVPNGAVAAANGYAIGASLRPGGA